MSRIALIPVLIVVTVFLTDRLYAAEFKYKSTLSASDTLQKKNKNISFRVYVGESTIVGTIGAELQYKKFGFNIGLFKDVIAVDNTLCGGIRYYFKPQHHSWVIGLGYGIALDEPDTEEVLSTNYDDGIPHGFRETGYILKSYFGLSIGYRWMWWEKLHLIIGAGPNFIKWKKIMEGTNEGAKPKYLPMLDFVLGYSF